MKPRWPQALIVITGGIFLVFGALETADQFNASTRFVGFELLSVGAILQTVGYALTILWKKPP
jgi:hypothetical protein